ncbi:MAG TPA: CxxxxCH/CxxCH domain-containing protein [Ignavibacteria bacterium]|nr:CxxxxCH/CxxCH domain-containing protein [Ignavibacteria bacterium]
MKKLFLFYGICMALIAITLNYQGCSELNNNTTLAPDIDTHPDGWANPSSSNFHGKYIFDNKQWNLTQCKTCHGGDYKGGTSGSNCLGCHTGSGGPQNCRLCHGNSEHSSPPKALNGDTSVTYIGVGVHQLHRTPLFSASVGCNECHTALDGFSDPNHIGDNPNGIAEINFGPLSRASIGGNITPDPQWDRNTATCSNVYCHGTFKEGNLTAAGVWTNPNSVVCGSCHGDPVTGNPTPRTKGVFTPPHFSFMTINSCYVCHETVINSQGVIFDKTKHVNGVINY